MSPKSGEGRHMPDLLEVPRWLEEHPELMRRGIKLTHPLKPWQVFRTQFLEEPAYAVKILEPESEEAEIYERLQHHQVPQNHVVPFELICGERPLLVMPCLGGLEMLPFKQLSLSGFLDAFLQVVEGVKFLHSINIAHLDVCFGNMVMATPFETRSDSRLEEERLYIIDYGTSRQLSSGPGTHPAITLPGAQTQTPLGITRLDPYSWDVYCLGRLFELLAQLMYTDSPSPPWIAHWITRWLFGEEKGCTGVCRCRPTARRAYLVISAIRWVIYAAESISKIIGRAPRRSPPIPQHHDLTSHTLLAPVA